MKPPMLLLTLTSIRSVIDGDGATKSVTNSAPGIANRYYRLSETIIP